MNKKINHSRGNFSDLFLDEHIYDNWFNDPNNKTLEGEKEETKFGDLPYIPPEGDNG